AVRLKGERDVDVDAILALDERWRRNLQELEMLRAERNRVSEEIGRLKKAGEPADDRIARMREVGDRIKEVEAEVRELQAQIETLLLNLPNLVHHDVPPGADEADNVEVRRWGEP